MRNPGGYGGVMGATRSAVGCSGFLDHLDFKGILEMLEPPFQFGDRVAKPTKWRVVGCDPSERFGPFQLSEPRKK